MVAGRWHFGMRRRFIARSSLSAIPSEQPEYHGPSQAKLLAAFSIARWETGECSTAQLFMKKCLIKTIFMQVLCMTAAFAQPNASCRYKPGPFHESIGGSAGCTSRCAAGPMKISPDPIEGCEGEKIIINARIEGGKMATFGDKQENAGGIFDWGMARQTTLIAAVVGTCLTPIRKPAHTIRLQHMENSIQTRTTQAADVPIGADSNSAIP